MDSWKCLSEGRGGWLAEELDFPIEGNGRCKSKVIGCEIKSFFNFENYPLLSNTQALERLDLMDLGFSDEIRKSYSLSSEPSGEVFSDEIGADSYGNIVSPLCEEKESGSRISADFMQSNNQDCALFDLKLGRLTDVASAKETEPAKASVYAPSTLLSLPVKRARSMNLNSQPPCCQVLGCNKDLSSCKGYYKRHKVCDVHTKTAKVIVDGIEQRFCQQCSRFHLLNEFDDGKRSCRRRLAAHNKRRRKPQLTSEAGTGVIGFSSAYAFPGVVPGLVISPGQQMSHVSSAAAGVLKDNMVGMTTPNVPNSSNVLQMSRALSLLSSKNMPSYGQLLDPSTMVGFHAPEMLSMEADKTDPTSTWTSPRHADTVDIEGHMSDGISRGPKPQANVKNTNNCHRLGQGIILDLLQLSSHLQRVEQQKHSTEGEAG